LHLNLENFTQKWFETNVAFVVVLTSQNFVQKAPQNLGETP
jgi:hypothetical protein